MIKLLFYRLLPAGAAAAILTSALSPLRPALDAWGAAATALTGQDPPPVEGAADLGHDLLQGPKAPPPEGKSMDRRKKLQALAAQLKNPDAPKLKTFAPSNAPARAEPRRSVVPRPVLRLRWDLVLQPDAEAPLGLVLQPDAEGGGPRAEGVSAFGGSVRTGDEFGGPRPSLGRRPYDFEALRVGRTVGVAAARVIRAARIIRTA